MRDTILRIVGALLGGIAGNEAFQLAVTYDPRLTAGGYFVTIAVILACGFAGYLILPSVARGFVTAMSGVLRGLAEMSLPELLLTAFGLTAGLGLAYLIGGLFSNLPLVGPFVPLLAALVLGYLGIQIAVQRRDELSSLARTASRGGPAGTDGAGGATSAKLLDTSVIIDGRIADICTSGFLDGPLFVPRSVLAELQRVADSPDVLRRNRGRRGLDILNRLQKDLTSVQILEDGSGSGDVDAQLVALARTHNAAIVTTDFNLSKVAELQGVRVLNVNGLAQALRPAVLPGEEISVQVIKDGKEAGQGVAYLEDGTMIVVEGGKRHIGETVDTVVTSVLQTAAGRMIFARPKSTEPTGSSPERR
jgi:uncharacterized protein YacL